MCCALTENFVSMNKSVVYPLDLLSPYVCEHLLLTFEEHKQFGFRTNMTLLHN